MRASQDRRRFITTCLFVVGLAVSSSVNFVQAADAQQTADELLKSAGFTGGFIVQLGADGDLAAALQKSSATQVQGLATGPEQVEAARQSIKKAGKYGDVAFDRYDGSQLPYVDNLVNLIVAEDLGKVPMSEVTRVLVPNGTALIKDASGKWKKTTKPRSDKIDEWSHYLHDATGNAVAHDEVVGPPRHLQWVGSPRWSRHHDRMASMSACVSAGGRMFYIMDEGSRISIQLPPKWKLIARDAFNGTVLWKRDISKWQNHLWPLKSGPTQLSRRVVASGDVVYATLDIDAPLTALSTATGETLRTYEGSNATEEIILAGDKLFLVVRKGEAELAGYSPLHGRVGDQAEVRTLFWNEEPRILMAFDAASGKQLWAKQAKVSPLTLAADGKLVYFHDGEKVVAISQDSGNVAWNSDAVTRRQAFNFNFGPRLVVNGDVVLYAGGDGKMFGIDIASGKQLWTAEHPNSGYQSPQDLIVMSGLVWCAPLTQGKDSGVFTGRDPRTGEVKKQFAPDVSTYWFHHRCYIAKATDRFLIPSRTGVEFVDPKDEHWDIHHWVRGGCLYGIMPCNGLTYTPPHDCACYPEAKLYGFNALAPAAPTRPWPTEAIETGRFEKGPAYDDPKGQVVSAGADDWPTFRHDQQRSGTAGLEIKASLKSKWSVELGGRLTPPVIAAKTVYIAKTDAHTLYALDEASGKEKWTFTAGGRIDSPPTIEDGRVVFGSTDGWIYCLRATDGKLAWRYRAAPMNQRCMAYEQLESLWPVHGSALVRDNQIYCVAGRSNFLDGGLRLVRLDLNSGKKLSETIMDDRNPETGNNMQEKLLNLQMPVGLPDILTCDGKHLFMKSQKFDLEGNRLEIGPNSGEFVEQVAKQRGPDAHIFAPVGFLDDSWFHRSYWVLGQSFAGGHGGYYQAGRFAPSGRILVNGNGYVFGYGRKPEYLRWTTTLEHQLFAAEPDPPEIPENFAKPKPNKAAASGGSTYAGFPNSATLDPTAKPITVEAWISATKPNGVIIARGGPSEGYALSLSQGKPVFSIRSGGELFTVEGDRRIIGGWHHVVGVLSQDKALRLYVDGNKVSEGKAGNLISKDPAQGLEIGADMGGSVGNYESPSGFSGLIDEVRIHFNTFPDAEIAGRFKEGIELADDAALAVSFDDGSARDLSTNRNNGTLEGGKVVEGKVGQAVQFSGGAGGGGKANNQNVEQAGNSLVKPKWTQDVPIYVRGMVLSGFRLFIVGPPDIIDEESTFQKLTEKAPEVQELLARQDAVLEGTEGALLIAVNAATGEEESRVVLKSLPAWDGMAGANGRLFLSTLDGKVVCFGE